MRGLKYKMTDVRSHIHIKKISQFFIVTPDCVLLALLTRQLYKSALFKVLDLEWL